jgi:hypothetical protein
MEVAMKAILVAALAVALAGPAGALTGREVIEDAQKRNGLSTWKDRVIEIVMESYTTTLQRTRDATVTEQTDPRGEHRTFMEFTGPADVTGTLFLHLSPRGATDQQWVWTPAARKARRLADASRDENFMGTDISYRDLELIVRIQQWNDDESTATSRARRRSTARQLRGEPGAEERGVPVFAPSSGSTGTRCLAGRGTTSRSGSSSA